ncbi:MAG: DNA helicase UvrD [Deltaproteobacteria bacterium]|nr:DNA helicase UvrD [Deltaproteobacteria bacterium]
MRFLADLHIHSHYSVATSKAMIPEQLHRWAQLKGITVLGTGDCCHPGWLSELQEKLVSAEAGLYKLRADLAEAVDQAVPGRCRSPVRFLLSAEISSIYKKDGRVRKIHSLLFLPEMQSAAALQAALARIGNIASDGRPILGLDAKELLKIAREVSEEIVLVPAHAWTPHFSILGARSGFDSLQECFEELTPLIPAIETGLSSDPPMNWRLADLANVRLISNSDAHSPAKLMREANLFDTDLTYAAIMRAICEPHNRAFLGTIEFFPQEGKYHYDGHRSCQIRLSPEETRKAGGLCPRCNRPVTVGVMHRVEELADFPPGHRPPGALPFRALIPLAEIIAEIEQVGMNSKKVDKLYMELLSRFGNEYHILVEEELQRLRSLGYNLLAAGIAKVREGQVSISPGYDGEFGTIRVFDGEERRELSGQLGLF